MLCEDEFVFSISNCYDTEISIKFNYWYANNISIDRRCPHFYIKWTMNKYSLRVVNFCIL